MVLLLGHDLKWWTRYGADHDMSRHPRFPIALRNPGLGVFQTGFLTFQSPGDI